MVDRRISRGLSWRGLSARPALFPALCLALGAAAGPKPGASAALFLCVSGALGALAVLLRGRPGAHLLLLAGFFGAGLGLSTLRAHVVVPPALLEGRTRVVLEGEVTEVAPFPDGVRVDVRVRRLTSGTQAPEVPSEGPVLFGARLYARGEAGPLFPGQRIRVPATLKPLEPPLNPGQPDFRARHLRRGTLLTGGFDPARLVRLSPPPSHSRWLGDVHARLAARTRQLAPSPEAAALYLTLAAGLRAELGDELEEQFGASGLAHVLSVSGLHVAILAVLLLKTLRRLLARVGPIARRLDVRRVAAPVAVPLVWGYVLFTGNQPPAVRSAVMATAVLLGMALWRRADGLNALALAAIALVVVEPAAVADLSSQLSFLAVASLIVVAPALRRALPLPPPPPSLSGWRRRFAHGAEGALSVFCASVAVTLTSAPLIAHVFQRLGLWGLVSNVVCLPLCGLLTLFAAGGAGLFVLLPVLADPLVFGGAWASEGLLWAVRLFAALPGSTVRVASVGALAGGVFLAAVFAWALVGGRLRWVGLVAPCALLLGAAGPKLLPEPGLAVTFLGVGHGDAIVLSSGGAHALLDGGGSAGGADTGRKYVLPYLRHLGIASLELAVLSHPHADHALGLRSVMKAIPTTRLWYAAGEGEDPLVQDLVAAAGPGAQVEEVERGHPALRLGEAQVEVLWPPADRRLLDNVNDRSVVLRVRHGEVTFLLTGDIEESAERDLGLLLGPKDAQVTVMKAPHHGSSTSSTEAFLARTRPKVAVFCVGRHHRWRFPREDVVARYEAQGAQCFRTDLHGAVRVESDGRDVRIRTFLKPAERASGATVAAHGGDPPDPGGRRA